MHEKDVVQEARAARLASARDASLSQPRSSDRGAWQFKYVHVDLGEDKPAWFKEAVNPFGTVPCVYDHGHGVFESAIIVEFLEVRRAARAAPAARQR
jgi:hypothetical protein